MGQVRVEIVTRVNISFVSAILPVLRKLGIREIPPEPFMRT